MAPIDKGTAVSTNAEVDSPNASKNEGSSRLMGFINLVGSVAVLCILIGTLAGIPGANDIKNTKDTTTALAANNFQSTHATAEFTISGITITSKLNDYYSIGHAGRVVETSGDGLATETVYATYEFGTCDTYSLSEGGSDDDDSRRLAESTHHKSQQLTQALAKIEAKVAKLSGKTHRHLDEKVSDECDDREDECKGAGQGASALFIISFILSFANAVVGFLTINGSDDTKTKIAVALHVIVILLTSIAVGLFTLDCTNLMNKDMKEGFEEGVDAIADQYNVDVKYTWVYNNGATFSCGITAIVLSFVLLVLRVIPQPVAKLPDVKEGETLVGDA